MHLHVRLYAILMAPLVLLSLSLRPDVVPVRAGEVLPMPVNVYHAGSLNGAVTEMQPGFTAATGYPLLDSSSGSVAIANEIHDGVKTPDVFMSADAEVNQVLMGPENGNKVRWYFIMARNRVVLTSNPQSRFKADLEAAAAGTNPGTRCCKVQASVSSVVTSKTTSVSANDLAELQSPGFRFERGDPATDPLAYRSVFVMQLAEQCYQQPGLADRVLGGNDNPAQIAANPPGDVQQGLADASTSYLSSAMEGGQPYITLPEAVDLSNPALGSTDAGASYTSPLGQTFHGTPTGLQRDDPAYGSE
ncbi:MAG: substrate-binding domain-containing protein [Dehalococcoidia bacterium]